MQKCLNGVDISPDAIVFSKEPWNVLMFETITKEMVETYKRKNADYGDSFGASIKEWGPVAGLVRIQDKFNRMKNLLKGNEQKVSDESILDTITDAACYCIMLRIALKEQSIADVDFEKVK